MRWLCIVVPASHTAVFFLIRSGQPDWVIMLCRAAEFLVMALIFFNYRPRTLWPTTPVERQLWSIWLAVFVSYALNVWIIRMLASHEAIVSRSDEQVARLELMFYPFSSVVAGIALFIMGSNYWGRCYEYGIAFFVTAALMPLKLEWAPLAFGFVWGVILFSFSRHLKNLSKDSRVTAQHLDY